jgi:hypothetical protein
MRDSSTEFHVSFYMAVVAPHIGVQQIVGAYWMGGIFEKMGTGG